MTTPEQPRRDVSPKRRPGAAQPTRTRREVSPARLCAYTVLRRVFEDGAYADRALQAAAARLDARDRALAMALSYGAVQRRGTLDHLIARLAGRPLARLDAPIVAALRLGLYELLYLEGAPDYAVLAESVELAKLSARAGHGLVNAVLRRASREGAAALLGDLHDDTPDGAAVMHSHPDWIARMWWEALGARQARALMAADNEPSELALRANTLLTDRATLASRLGVRSHDDARLAEALVLEEPFDVHGSPLWRDGLFAAQSRAAMLVAHALAPQPGERVLDLCAAPGGKATHLAALMSGEGELVAVERDPRRAAVLRETAERMCAKNVVVEVADAGRPREGDAGFDRVLLDPPCSGLGTLQARPDLRWRVRSDSLAELVALQRRILAAGARALRPGGVLVYSTCTISPDENERLIDAFLDSHPGFALEDLPAELVGLGSPATAGGGIGSGSAGSDAGPLHRGNDSDSARRGNDSGSSGSAVQTLPHHDRTAGFFIARLRRR